MNRNYVKVLNLIRIYIIESQTQKAAVRQQERGLPLNANLFNIIVFFKDK